MNKPARKAVFTRATRAQPKAGPARTLNLHTNEEDGLTAPKSATESLDVPASLHEAPSRYPRGRIVDEDEDGLVVVVNPPSASSPPPSQHSAAQTCVL